MFATSGMAKEISKPAKPKKNRHVYILLGDDEHLKDVFTNQLKRFHGRFAWQVATTPEQIKKEVQFKRNVIYRADPTVHDITEEFLNTLPDNYSRRVVCMGDDFKVNVRGADNFYRWPLRKK